MIPTPLDLRNSTTCSGMPVSFCGGAAASGRRCPCTRLFLQGRNLRRAISGAQVTWSEDPADGGSALCSDSYEIVDHAEHVVVHAEGVGLERGRQPAVLDQIESPMMVPLKSPEVIPFTG